MDSVRLQWDRLFVHFSANDQLTVVQGLRESGEAVRTKLSESLNSLSAQSSAMLRQFMSSFTTAGMPEALLLIILAIGAAYAGRLLLRSSRHTTSPPDVLSAHQRTVVTLYTNMLHCLAQRGIVKPASATPMELLRHVREEWAEAWPCADALTHLYTRVRFGHAPLTPEDRTVAENLLRRLRTLERATTSSQQ